LFPCSAVVVRKPHSPFAVLLLTITMGVPEVVPVVGNDAVLDAQFDAVLVVTSSVENLTKGYPFSEVVFRNLAVDKSAYSKVSFTVVSKEQAAGGRLILSPTGPLNRDYDDVRRFADAARAAVSRAKAAGATRLLLLVQGIPTSAQYARGLEVALLGALAVLYEPLQAREADASGDLEPIKVLGFVADSKEHGETVARLVSAIEIGRRLTRDIGSGDPERMAAPNVAAYITTHFADHSNVKVEVIADRDTLQKEYPLADAVGRCAWGVERHRSRIIRLTYEPTGEVNQTLLLAGKGITYDTGGADIKAGGHMAGMHMDKGGAAAFAGFVKTVALLNPKGLKVIAELAFVRNSSGADNYVSDEIVKSHAGVRVMVGNTDAEGRMVLADCVSHCREYALKEKNPHIMTCATLTGHVGRAYGLYTAAMDNGPALAQGRSVKLQAAGEVWGDPFEISTLRRDDYDFIAPKNSAYDVLQCNNLPSSATARGHQFPAAFIIIASGLDKHGIDSEHPIPFSHIDIAGSACEDDDYQFGRPTAAPLVALTGRYVLAHL